MSKDGRVRRSKGAFNGLTSLFAIHKAISILVLFPHFTCIPIFKSCTKSKVYTGFLKSCTKCHFFLYMPKWDPDFIMGEGGIVLLPQ